MRYMKGDHITSPGMDTSALKSDIKTLPQYRERKKELCKRCWMLHELYGYTIESRFTAFSILFILLLIHFEMIELWE